MIRPALTFSLLMVTTVALAQAQAQAQVDTPLVRSWIEPDSGVVIGQPVRLHVEVLFAGDMPRPPLVRVSEAPGAQIMRFQTQAITVRKTIDGQDFVGQDFEFMIFPRRGGVINVPAPVVTLLNRAGDPTGSVTAPPVQFSVTVPPGIDPSGPVLASSSVSISQSWSPDPESMTFAAGGALVRTIRRQAADTPGGAMAAFAAVAPEGVRVYTDPPQVDDKVDRGAIEGRRVDRFTYVFEKPGAYAIPALTQPWWDSVANQVRSQTLDGLTVTVKATAPASPHGWRGVVFTHWSTIAAGAAGLALVLAMIVARPRLAAAWKRRRARHAASEAYARKSLRRIARTGDAPATYQALQTWLGRLPPGDMDPHLQRLIAQLENGLFGDGSWGAADGKSLANFLNATGDARERARGASPPALPALNPPAVRKATGSW